MNLIKMLFQSFGANVFIKLGKLQKTEQKSTKANIYNEHLNFEWFSCELTNWFKELLKAPNFNLEKGTVTSS